MQPGDERKLATLWRRGRDLRTRATEAGQDNEHRDDETLYLVIAALYDIAAAVVTHAAMSRPPRDHEANPLPACLPEE